LPSYIVTTVRNNKFLRSNPAVRLQQRGLYVNTMTDIDTILTIIILPFVVVGLLVLFGKFK